MEKNKLIVGRKRKKQISEEQLNTKNGALCGGLFALGIVAVFASLVIPMSGKPVPDNDSLIPTMSGAVETGEKREILAEPKVHASADEEWSIFEYIGDAIASLLTGEK